MITFAALILIKANKRKVVVCRQHAVFNLILSVDAFLLRFENFVEDLLADERGTFLFEHA